MNSVQPALLEHVLERMPIGVVLLDCTSLRILYMNTYLQSLLPSSWLTQGLIGHSLRDIVPDEEYNIVEPIIQKVCLTGQSIAFSDIPYEGFLETRGRTYWHISIELTPGTLSSSGSEVQDAIDLQDTEQRLLITIKDVTNQVRSSMHLNAIHQISSAILERLALPQVLDSILQAVQDLVGSTRCAIILLDHSLSLSNLEKNALPDKHIPTALVAAQKGLHLSSQNWHPPVNEKLLLNQVLHSHHSLAIPDTDAWPSLTFPLLDDNGIPRRPGSVLCVPIFEPDPTARTHSNHSSSLVEHSSGSKLASKAILGTIEVYHRRARGLPFEEVELLEQFAQQAGLAIQNARLLLSVDRTNELAKQNQALQAAQAAQELESARLRLLMKRLPSGVMLVSADDKRISVINHQAVELLQRMGVPLRAFYDADQLAEDAVGLNIENAFRALTFYDTSGSIIVYEEQPLFRALQNGEASEVELRITQPDKQVLFLLISAAPLLNHDGSITDAVLVLQDFTKLKALERAREDFFTTMAHELKTPLANIRAHLSALQADDFKWSPEAQRNFLETADEQVERLVGMINHFLDASRIEAGALRLELEPILLPEMFEDLQERLEALITSSQRRFEVHVPIDLPAVQADYELIMGVLTNLLSNAFRYAPEGDTVRLEAEPLFDISHDQIVEVEIRVTDRGPGITEERQAELFTRFSTFASMRRPTAERPGQPIVGTQRGNSRWSPATGLGLYISRGIIEAHGRELRLKSNPGEGATFAFTLPVAASINSEV
jgi:signal transduction histidine kinase